MRDALQGLFPVSPQRSRRMAIRPRATRFKYRPARAGRIAVRTGVNDARLGVGSRSLRRLTDGRGPRRRLPGRREGGDSYGDSHSRHERVARRFVTAADISADEPLVWAGRCSTSGPWVPTRPTPKPSPPPRTAWAPSSPDAGPMTRRSAGGARTASPGRVGCRCSSSLTARRHPSRPRRCADRRRVHLRPRRSRGRP